jgi:hypothetical protein
MRQPSSLFVSTINSTTPLFISWPFVLVHGKSLAPNGEFQISALLFCSSNASIGAIHASVRCQRIMVMSPKHARS